MKKKNYTYYFWQFHTIRSFAKSIFTNKTTLDEPHKDQLELKIKLIESIDFK